MGVGPAPAGRRGVVVLATRRRRDRGGSADASHHRAIPDAESPCGRCGQGRAAESRTAERRWHRGSTTGRSHPAPALAVQRQQAAPQVGARAVWRGQGTLSRQGACRWHRCLLTPPGAGAVHCPAPQHRDSALPLRRPAGSSSCAPASADPSRSPHRPDGLCRRTGCRTRSRCRPGRQSGSDPGPHRQGRAGGDC